MHKATPAQQQGADLTDTFNRTERIIGSDALARLRGAAVIVFGLGGVGSWTAEALARSGVGRLTIVDPDVVAASNINRQLPALVSTIGMPKTEVMARRLTDINPDLQLTAITERYCEETAGRYDLDAYDYVVDAIDSVADKALLICRATRSRARLVSSMGAALKMHPARIETADFSKVRGCRLAAALRRRFKITGEWPARKFKCVFSEELLPNHEVKEDTSGAMTFGKRQINGAIMHVTAIFGLTLASLVIEGLTRPPGR